jgi:hypothetical protein
LQFVFMSSPPQNHNGTVPSAPWSDAGAPLLRSSSTTEAHTAARAPVEVPANATLSFDLSTAAPTDTPSGHSQANEYLPREPARVGSGTTGGTADRKGIFGVLLTVGAFLLKFKALFAFLKFGQILTTCRRCCSASGLMRWCGVGSLPPVSCC